jgi:predicted hydrocarbon binding protein
MIILSVLQPPDPLMEKIDCNRLLSVFFQASEQILGSDGLSIIFPPRDSFSSINPRPLAQSPGGLIEYINKLQSTLECTHGETIARGLAIRIGRACFTYGIREFGSQLGLTGSEFRLMPFQRRLVVCIETIASLFNEIGNNHVSLKTEDKSLTLLIDLCPFYRDEYTERPQCSMVIGIVQEALFWTSRGKHFEVIERKCCACGDNVCEFHVNLVPLA